MSRQKLIYPIREDADLDAELRFAHNQESVVKIEPALWLSMGRDLRLKNWTIIGFAFSSIMLACTSAWLLHTIRATVGG